MATPVPRYLSAAGSDQGFVRPNNEDRVYCDDARGFFFVVDGMGGHEAGEQAAEIAVERIRVRLERQTGDTEQRLREAITLANNAIFTAAQENPEWEGMACVLTAAAIDDGQVTVGHVGDSRLYKIKRGAIKKMTFDHSPVGQREDSGELTEAEAMQHPRRNEVFRDVGSEEHTPGDENFIEISQFPFEPDSAFLICSDGLSDALSSQSILEIIEKHAGDRWAAVRALLSAATKIGKDNVSVVLVEGDAFAASFDQRFVAPHHQHEIPWYRKTPALLSYGLLLGALLTFAVQTFLLPDILSHGGRTLVVSAPGSISDALAKAQPGDTVEVGSGTYEESLQLKNGVTVIAQRAHEAILQGTVSADGLQQARFEGFGVRGGGDDPAIRIRNSNVILARNDVSESHAAGIEVSGNSRGAIFACNIHSNAGSGILLADNASPAIENNLILENGVTPTSLRPGIFVRSSAHSAIARNTFGGNGAEGIWLPATEETMMQRNFFLPEGHVPEASKVRIVPLGEGRP